MLRANRPRLAHSLHPKSGIKALRRDTKNLLSQFCCPEVSLESDLGSYFLITLFIYFWLYWVFVTVRAFSSCREWGLVFIAMHGLFIVVASLVVEHRL